MFQRGATVGCGMALCLGMLAGSLARAQDNVDPFASFVSPTEPLSAAEQQAKFHLPPGFEIQLVAAEPDIRKPINLAFDGRGSLVVTQSIEYPFGAGNEAPPRDEVRVFEAIGADGRPRAVRVFAGELNIPIGVLPLAQGAIVYAIPNIWRLADDNADDAADRRDLLYGPFGHQDTHGMCNSFRRWIDGWVYACHGFANTSNVSGGDGQAIEMHSGNSYRFRLDGSRIEYFTHGQVNPFGLAFDPLGNLYSSDCHTLPLYQLLRGAWYPSFGKPDDGLGFGPQMLSHLHGSTGIAGVVYYAAEQFPSEYRDTVFIGNPVTGRINHDRLERHGSTLLAREASDFLSCDDPWFRPVDVRLGPDGALYIADFYNCIIGHYEVPLTHPRRDRALGRLWRVVYRGEGSPPAKLPSLDEKNLAGASVERLVAALGDANLEFRVQATHALVDEHAQAAVASVRAVIADGTTWQRVHGMWVLERLSALDDADLQKLASDAAAEVRVHAIKLLAERATWTEAQIALVQRALHDDDAFVVRAAADALGRHPRREQLTLLLDLWDRAPFDDTHLIHVVRMAARDHLLAPDGFDWADHALEANPRYGSRLAELCLGAPIASSSDLVHRLLTAGNTAPPQFESLVHHATRRASEAALPTVLAFAESCQNRAPAEQQAVLRAVFRGLQERSVPPPPALVAWGQTLGDSLLASDEESTARQGIDLAQTLRLAAAPPRLVELAKSQERPAGLRDAAVGACVAIDAGGSVPLLVEMLADSASPLPLRQRAARDLAGAGGVLGRATLAATLATAPERLAVEIASALAGSDPGLSLLLDTIEAGKASPALLQDWMVNLRLNGLQVAGTRERVAALTAGLPPADKKLRGLIDARREAFASHPRDPAAGGLIFEKHCAVCHRLAGRGTKIGPELDGVGVRGIERLLEDLLNPSGNVDQAFRRTTVALRDGRTLEGLVLREEGDLLVLANQQGQEQRVPLAEIEDRAITPVSPMPANVADLLTEADFHNLVAHLLAQRAATK